MSDLRMDGRVAIVTGAGRGIGREHALLLAKRGAAVVVNDFGGTQDGTGGGEGPAADVAREIVEAGGRAVANNASVASEDGAASIVTAALDAFGRIDIVVNNAGIFDPGRFAQLSIEQFRRMIDVHYMGTLLVTKAAWPHMEAAGYGRLVNTISEAILGAPQMTSYGAAKGAIFGLTRNLAVDGAAHGILANCLAPRAGTRMVDTLGSALSLPESMVSQMKAEMPPEFVVPAALYLAHEDCTLTGEILQVGSGRVSRLVVLESAGITTSSFSPEDLRANLDQVMDLTGAELRGPLIPEIPVGLASG